MDNLQLHENRRMHSAFVAGIKDCLPTVFGYLSIGFAFGVIGRTMGLSIVEILFMSIFVYAGSSQFIMTGMIAAGGTPVSIAITVFFVNLRHLLMSASLSPYFKHLPAWKAIIIGTQLTDETFGVAATKLSGQTAASGRWMLGLNMTAHINWVFATVVGAIFGQWIANPEQLGLGFALPAMFVGLLVVQFLDRGKWRTDLIVAGAAVACTVACSIWISQTAGVMIAAMAAATIGAWIDKWR